MKVNINYKGKSVELDIPDEKLEELVKEQKKTGWEKPDLHKNYWYINGFSGVERSSWYGEYSGAWYYDCGNCFMSKELAENIARYQSLDLRIRRRIAEICEPVDWNTHNSAKWTIVCDHPRKMLYVDCYYNQHFGQWNCDTKAHAEQIIEEFKDELIWYFTEFKDRMDG